MNLFHFPLLLCICFHLSQPLLAADATNPCALFTKVSQERQDPRMGGFAYGMSAREITEIASSFSVEGNPIIPIMGKSPETVLINASRRNNFYDKMGSIIRDITGSHMFNDANHRIIYEIVNRLFSRNGVINKPSKEDIYILISKVGRNAEGFQTAEEIGAYLRGYK